MKSAGTCITAYTASAVSVAYGSTAAQATAAAEGWNGVKAARLLTSSGSGVSGSAPVAAGYLLRVFAEDGTYRQYTVSSISTLGNSPAPTVSIGAADALSIPAAALSIGTNQIDAVGYAAGTADEFRLTVTAAAGTSVVSTLDDVSYAGGSNVTISGAGSHTYVLKVISSQIGYTTTTYTYTIMIAATPPAAIYVADDGSITEGGENGEMLTVTLRNDVFTAGNINASNVTLTGVPSGVTVGTVSYVNDHEITITLSGTAADYDANITATVTVKADALHTGTVDVTGSYIFIATVD